MRYLATTALFLALLAADTLAQGVVLQRRIEDETDRTRRLPPDRPTLAARHTAITLKQHSVSIRIEDQAARTEVTQIFHNSSGANRKRRFERVRWQIRDARPQAGHFFP